jgi:hypothetical protein
VTGPVAGVAGDGLAAAVNELEVAGGELVGEPGPSQQFRVPDGNIYELWTQHHGRRPPVPGGAWPRGAPFGPRTTSSSTGQQLVTTLRGKPRAALTCSAVAEKAALEPVHTLSIPA